jgi:hypothetical protein
MHPAITIVLGTLFSLFLFGCIGIVFVLSTGGSASLAAVWVLAMVLITTLMQSAIELCRVVNTPPTFNKSKAICGGVAILAMWWFNIGFMYIVRPFGVSVLLLLLLLAAVIVPLITYGAHKIVHS